MRSRDVRATTAGLLFIAATATSLIATAFLGSLLKGPGFLATAALHQDRLLTAALFQLIAVKERLRSVDRRFEIEKLSYHVVDLAHKVLRKHRYVNAGWAFTALALIALVAAGARFFA